MLFVVFLLAAISLACTVICLRDGINSARLKRGLHVAADILAENAAIRDRLAQLEIDSEADSDILVDHCARISDLEDATFDDEPDAAFIGRSN